MRRLKTLLLTLLCASALTGTAQNTKLNLDTRSAKSTAEYVKEMHSAGGMLSYQHTGFLNSTFHQNRANEVITGGGGLEFTYLLRLWLFRLDFGAFYGSFDVQNSAYKAMYQQTSYTSYAGVNVFANFLPMPCWGKISKFIVPSIGIGYQTTSLAPQVSSKNSNGENTTKSAGSLGVGGLMFKGCLQLHLGGGFVIHSEYRQGLNIASNKAPYTFAVGIGYIF